MVRPAADTSSFSWAQHMRSSPSCPSPKLRDGTTITLRDRRQYPFGVQLEALPTALDRNPTAERMQQHRLRTALDLLDTLVRRENRVDALGAQLVDGGRVRGHRRGHVL